MLKALELVGFKSFADRTRFDFPDGITVVVGPNGSGKSNVVDAIKWVLGAQSAKALRGSEMTDVIFKGSAEGGRKPANSAEVLLVLDNRSRLIAMEADEIHVCRRVYRSGEGEYAINGQPCRLKDVRDLFRGTGVGVDAYSLIEQGKVDRLLQSSPRDRRAIFEEAAGISRFKAKKAEAERRLGRVDQNMLRIRDIVDELGKRLATLKSQASKAQRYREWTTQAIEKRRQLGALELRDLRRQLATVEDRIRDSTLQIGECSEQLTAYQNKSQDRKHELDQTEQRLSECLERRNALQREHVQGVSEQLSVKQRQAEWQDERATLLERIELLERRVSVGEGEIAERKKELELQASDCRSAQADVQSLETELQTHVESVAAARLAWESKRTELESLRQRMATVQVDATSQFRALEQIEFELARIQSEMETKSQAVSHLQSELHLQERGLKEATGAYQTSEENKQVAKRNYEEVLERQRAQQQMVLESQARIQGLIERLHILSQLEEQFTNAGRGGQQLMRSANALATSNPHYTTGVQSIQGLVADLITTDLPMAPLVDVALGTYADAIVLSDGQLVDWINDGRLVPEGRVTLLRLDRLPTRRTGEKIQLDGLRGVVGRADRLVRYDSAHESLVRALLGTTWFVESLATALDLSHFRGAGLRFVTAECQLIDSDGSITIGSLQSGLGLVSRRSEMQATAEQKAALMAELETAKASLASLDEQLMNLDGHVRSADENVVEAAKRVAAIEQRIESIRHQLQQAEDEWKRLQVELTDRTAQRDVLDRSLVELDRERVTLEERDRELQSELDERTARIQECDHGRQIFQDRLTEGRVRCARMEQRLEGMKTTLAQLLEDATEREGHVQEARTQLTSLEQKIATADATWQSHAQRIAELESMMHSADQQRSELDAQRAEQQMLVNEFVQQRDQLQRQLDKLQDRLVALQAERSRNDEQLRELLARYMSDFQIDLHGISPEDQELAQWNRTELEAELTQLRQEIASAGSVNMEALEELDALQSRYDRMAGQERDLLDAKDGLIRTMQKIDEDSQSLFLETLETIRVNFQQLYRKSFGGGSADIVLENPADPESGIEILATPPGKTTFSNSLLSGGEKALTAVSLIMAFFQYRPSPFCILDEVDAPFDEANIGRFVTVLNEFLDSTKFIVVTHSKKTMTVANMIYGVTMQESGVSRQVAVKFEEVNEEGEVIRRAA